MNKNDFKLTIVIFIIIIIIFIIHFINKKNTDTALVYYDSKLILKINLEIDKIYDVAGENGIVKIEVKNKKIRVIQENSPNHICSKQGFISKAGEVIICLPNKIIIELPSENIDTEVR